MSVLRRVEGLYPLAPVWLQNLGISLFGLTWRHERLGGHFREYVQGFMQRDRWSMDQMQDYLDRKLRNVLIHAAECVPYYMRSFKDAGISLKDPAEVKVSDLPSFPIVPKQALRSRPYDFVAQDLSPFLRLHRYYSSGTTGTPITAICTSDGHRKFIAGREVRSFGWAGTSLRKPRSMIGGRLVVPKGIAQPPFHRYNWVEQQLYLSAYHISPHNILAYVDAFNQYRPKVMTGYAYSHYILARMMCEKGVRLDYQPDALVLSSEKLTTDMKRTIQQAFGARAYEEYGAVENCLLATECEHGALHVSPDFGIVEIVDDAGQPVGPGVEGRIICSSLLNDAQPLIRYDIGDRGIWSSRGCPCGRDQLPILEEVVGRLEDLVIGPDGREMVRFHGIFVNLPYVIEGQVIQNALDTFTTKLVVQEGFGSPQEETIRRRFTERLGPVRVIIERVDHIPRTERGKFRAVVSLLRPDQREPVVSQVKKKL